jgi:L-ascorbate metabolism protein UlaG (beta-lactamase superfamily)
VTLEGTHRYDWWMEIYWLGHGTFRLRGKEATVVTDPAPPSTGYKIGKIAADIVSISSDDPDVNNRAAIQGEPKFITGPGEYEIGGVLLTAVRTNHDKGADGRKNVAFVFDIDDIHICHLGSIDQVPHADDVEFLGAADILLLPIGGGKTLNVAQAAETISVLDPKIVIPMRYRTEATTEDLESVDRFLKELGAEGKKPETRLSITKSNIPSDTTVVLLEYRG